MTEVENEKLLALLQRLSVNSDISENELSSLIASKTDACRVPPLQNPDVPYSAEDFLGLARNAQLQLHVLLKILGFISHAKSNNHQFAPLFMKNTLVSCFLSAVEYTDSSWEWSDESCAKVSANILTRLCDMFEYSSVQELLTGTVDSTFNSQSVQTAISKSYDVEREDGCLKLVLQELSKLLNKKSWRSYPALKMSYWIILQQVNCKHLGEHLAYLLPPALFILDDWEHKNKCLGLKCLKYILDNTAGGELRWYGRAHVIYDAMKPMIYSREPELLKLLYSTITQAARVLEEDPTNKATLKHESRYDFLLDQLLREMECEQKVSLRTVYAAALPLILSHMGISAIRWSENLLKIFADYLAVFDGPEAADRVNIIKCVQVYVRECWPRVHVEAESILNMVVRLVYDVTLQDSGVSAQSVSLLSGECVSVVRLVYNAAPTTTQELCCGLDSLTTLHLDCKQHLTHILAAVDASGQTGLQQVINQS